MYQSPYFVEECKKKMNPISSWGFILSEEISDDRWALLGWDNKWITPPKKQRKF